MINILQKILSRNKSTNQTEHPLKYLITGLGNIGEEYKNTRHNIGFNVLDAFAKSQDATFTSSRYADMAKIKFKGRIIILIKPTTFMNLSGNSVRYWMQKENIPLENLLVICDDLALSLGTLRMKGKGGDGGHNGLINIIEQIGTTNFTRLRFGIGDNFPKGKQINYVLGKWTKEEEPLLPSRIEIAIEMIKSFTALGSEKTMTAFNNK